jgi:acyl-CoA thioesterase YciA
MPDGEHEAPGETPVIRTIAMPSDTNPEGDIFGGWLMSQMDLAGATVAFRLSSGRCATVAVDGMTFLSPVSVGDEVSLYAWAIRVGRTSVQVAVEAWKRPRHGETVTKVTAGAFTYVAIDADRRPRPVTAGG